MEGDEQTKCQSAFRNLLRMPERDGPELATIWIREFMQVTQECDRFQDMSCRRAAWRKHLGEDAFHKIMSFDQTDPSVPERAASTLQHYLHYDRGCLIKGLDWSNWLGYQFIDRVQMTSAFISLFGGSGAAIAWVVAKKSRRHQQPHSLNHATSQTASQGGSAPSS
jgi:hypothetical protein